VKAKDKKSTTAKPPTTSKSKAKPKTGAKAPQVKPVFNTRFLKGLVTDAASKKPGKARSVANCLISRG
jgi:hypothetical protein